MRLLATLEAAVRLEEKIFACYEKLSEMAEDGLSGELKVMAQEEKSHISVLKTGKNFVFRAPDVFGRETASDFEIQEGIKTTSGLHSDLATDKAEFRKGLKRLHDIEKKLEKVHMNTAVEINDFSLKKLFEALARADAEHRQRLERLIARL
jgi:rubrerythrin